jgi:hypothetical protein
MFNVSVPLARVSMVTASFAISPGNGISCKLLGSKVNCESAGALIWSIWSSSRRCLGVQLLDEEGNNAKNTLVNVTVQARDSFMNAYALLNFEKFNISSDGSILWCELYSTNVRQTVVQVGVSVGLNVTWLAGSFNVSSPGLPAGLSRASVFNQSSAPIIPGQSLPSVIFNVIDVAGNTVVNIMQNIVVRIAVSPRRTASVSRKLLNTYDEAVSVMCPSLTYVNISEGSPGLISVSLPQLCTAGENDIVYAVGEMLGETFVSFFSLALATVVTVIPGPIGFFFINDPGHIHAQSYHLITEVALTFHDKGGNIVGGSARMTLQPLNSSHQVYPSHPLEVYSNGSEAAKFPPFFLFVSQWDAAVSSAVVLISIDSSVESSKSNIFSVNLTATCLAGSSLNFSDGNANVAFVYRALIAGRPVLCSPCTKPEYDSTLLDAPECFTLMFINAPLLVHSGKALVIDHVAAITDSRHMVEYATGWTVKMKLQRVGSFGFALNTAVTLQQGRSQPMTIVPAYAEEPASDYFWILQLYVNGSGRPFFINVTLPIRVTVLDFSPESLRMVPNALSHDGHESITVTGIFPSGVQNTFFSSSILPALRNNSLLFKSASSSRQITLTATVLNTSRSEISFICGPLILGGNTLTKSWVVSMLFSDGRESAELLISAHCPAGKYMELGVTSSCSAPPCCFGCPSPMSSSFSVDSIDIRSCVCQVGYYGTGGLACTVCPRNVQGFNCSLSNQSWPAILTGYYIDYSMLTSCSEYGPKCKAITQCPNKNACPGTTERECLKTKDECYSSESVACTACCPGYYIEDFVCKLCPASQLPIILAVCTIGLILFAVLSSTFDFPPLLSVAQSLKIFLSSMQGFVSVRLLAISWPPIVLNMIDITRFFTFTFDVIRPECTVSYTPQTKLLFMVIGPAACSLCIGAMGLGYLLFKCHRISKMLQIENVKALHNKTFHHTALSVVKCLFTTSLCFKFSNSRMMVDGALWNALSPALALRSNLQVLKQKFRRKTVLHDNLNPASPSRALQEFALPEDWVAMQDAVANVGARAELARSAVRLRRLISSALSIFIFTFQGSIESAFSTFDCKEQNDMSYLRSNPKFRCSFDDDMYTGLVSTSIIGIAIYCILLPTLAITILRSRWCREVKLHDIPAYEQMFGFITSAYSKACALWELVACLRKLAFVAIPIFLSTDTLVQTVLMFFFVIIYAFLILRFQPMASAHFNLIEIISSISVIVSCFSSIFFVIEYKGSQVLSGASRDTAGLILVIACATCVLVSFRLMWKEFSKLMLVYSDKFMSKWVVEIKKKMVGMCEESFVIPTIVLFYNDVATVNILKLKSKMRMDLGAIEERSRLLANLPWYHVGKRLKGCLQTWLDRIAVHIGVWRYDLPENDVKQCLEKPEFEFIKYLHKLTERMTAWRRYPFKHLSSDQLPKEFVDIKGLSDTPKATYEHLYNIQKIMDAYIPADLQRTLCALMLSYLTNPPQHLTTADTAYDIFLLCLCVAGGSVVLSSN